MIAPGDGRRERNPKMIEQICLTCEYYTPFPEMKNLGYCDLRSRVSTDDLTCREWVKSYVLHVIEEGEKKE